MVVLKAPSQFTNNAEVGVVAFHTLFNFLGVILILPFTYPFAKLITRLIPASGHQLTRRLQTSLLIEPSIALENVHATLRELAGAVIVKLMLTRFLKLRSAM